MSDIVPSPPAHPPDHPPAMPRPVRRVLGLLLLAAGLAIPGCVALFNVP
jgi:hypothetical protein